MNRHTGNTNLHTQCPQNFLQGPKDKKRLILHFSPINIFPLNREAYENPVLLGPPTFHLSEMEEGTGQVRVLGLSDEINPNSS